MSEPVCLSVRNSVCLFVRNRILNYGSNQKMFITKVVRLAMKVNMVEFFLEKIRKNQIKMEKNWINWKYKSNQKMFVKEVSGLPWKQKLLIFFFFWNWKKSDQNGKKLNNLELQLQPKFVIKESYQAYKSLPAKWLALCPCSGHKGI